MNRNVGIIIWKQMKDTLKNKAIFIQFVMFPVLCIIMTKSIHIDGMPADFFVNMFAAMYIGMAPLTSIAAIIAEEKEKNTLRVLMMAKVTPWQYLLGTGCYVFFFCMLGAVVFSCLLGKGTAFSDRMMFLFVMAVGIIVSLLIGAAIGVGSRNQMAATSVTVPVMIVFSFLPMISVFNEAIAKVAKYTYSEQVRIMISAVGSGQAESGNLLVIAGNMIVFGGLFWMLYRKEGLV